MNKTKRIHAIGLWEMEDRVREGQIDPGTCYISINEPGYKSPLPDGPNVLVLHFDDLDSPVPGMEDRFVLFDRAMGEKVVSFLRGVGSRPLVVHCHLGSSRSGALAYFAHELFGMKTEQLHKNHPLGLKPNPLVLRVLRDVAGMPHNSLPDWCVYNDDVAPDPDSIF